MTVSLTLEDLEGRATISVEEAAHVLGISRGVAYEAARTGQLPCLHLGKRVLVSVPALVRQLNEAS